VKPARAGFSEPPAVFELGAEKRDRLFLLVQQCRYLRDLRGRVGGLYRDCDPLG
jgi:hypothetical protein